LIFSTPIAQLQAPLTLLPFVLVVFFFGPLPEEMGWRGYALDQLQARHSPLVASLILGSAWSLWHLPMYLIEGTFQHGMGLGSPLFWIFSLGMLPQSILMAWIYNNTRRSTLSAALFHFAINFSGEFFEPTTLTRAYQLILTTLLAIVVTWVWDSNRF
jgi:membrane protease YdiL (CAAX protease family)